MSRSTVFKTNRTQAVRLPKALALPANVREVDIIKVGHNRVISPAGKSWDAFFDGAGVSNDFMVKRRQPAPSRRKRF